MPFSHVAASYQPEQLAKLTEAFHRVWPRVFLANGGDSDDELNRLQQRLANYLLACASRVAMLLATLHPFGSSRAYGSCSSRTFA